MKSIVLCFSSFGPNFEKGQFIQSKAISKLKIASLMDTQLTTQRIELRTLSLPLFLYSI